MARRVKRDFATIRQLPSRRWQVRYTGPDGERRTAPSTFAYRVDADAWVESKRKEIYRETWEADDETGARHLRRVRGAMAHGPPGGRAADKARTREHYQDILDATCCRLGCRSWPPSHRRVRSWHTKH